MTLKVDGVLLGSTSIWHVSLQAIPQRTTGHFFWRWPAMLVRSTADERHIELMSS